MQEILDYLVGKGDVVFFDWNRVDILDFKILVVDNFTGDENELKLIIENSNQIVFFDLVESVIKCQIIPKS
jgi:hypothetical protein